MRKIKMIKKLFHAAFNAFLAKKKHANVFQRPEFMSQRTEIL